jgi:hypothetical protein
VSPVATRAEGKVSVKWDDTRLVKECLAGNEEAWSLLIEKYKALIYSIPVKYGLPPHEAADVFQVTCMELLARLPDLREPRAAEMAHAGGAPPVLSLEEAAAARCKP